jgi:hypothetical protein
MNPVLVLNLFKGKGRRNEQYSIAAAEAVLDGLANANVAAWRLNPNLPLLYESGVRYRREPAGQREYWKNYPAILKDRFADCDDLSAARVGELRALNIDPGARVFIYRTSPRTLHAVVKRSSGLLEDPSRVLGMGRP